MRDECANCPNRERCLKEGEPAYCSDFQDKQSVAITNELSPMLDELEQMLEEVYRHDAICSTCEDKPGCWGANGDEMPDGCTKWDPALAEAFGLKHPSDKEMEIIEQECGIKSCADVCGRFGIFHCPLK